MLAQEKHLSGTARLKQDGDLARHYIVPNAERNGSEHWVSISLDGRTLTCDCVAGTYQRPCSHAGSVLHAEALRQQAEASANDEPMRSFCNGLDW